MEPLNIRESVKQGGILSPYLFNFFINDLTKSSIDLNLGAKIGGINAAVVAYCDDIAILSPLASHAQKILDRIYEYSLLWKIEFNAKKSS
ncbi:RNA-directed DNA polymerase from mobile element jockey-like [Brachionus plicatilis]|uniref:RNA-directed DNA polymerase from mobile element jockey-like n=1 Tax=Brachionus plicatilis TaxID=10195 RepID=A0A3M7QUA3_BRAPC|nr:RNA-directed DNA polymerase from mobile element jockey-like [Brachionus plicatilis]